MSNNNDAAIALLEKHFDIAFAAPDGIKKLRELILSLAMQGKLVPQDPSDQPASELLKEIERKKRKLLAEKKVKYKKISESPDIESRQYKIPNSWLWFSFKDVVFFQEGPGIRNWQFTNEGIKLLNVSNILADGNLNFSNSDKYVAVDEFLEKYTHFEVADGDLLFASSGGSWGKIAWYKDPGFRVMLNTSTIRLRFFDDNFEENYLYYFLKTAFFREQMEIQLVGMQPNFGSTHLSRIYIPLPPLAEQRRIVAKIDELMARCDELEKLRGDRDRKQIAVHNSTLNRLLIAKEQSEFNTAWQFITQHFSELYSVKQNVTELRKTILQLAVMGKLVPQDPNDQPASELLKEIAKGKERLIKEGKIKKPKPLPEIKPDEVPYNSPQAWEWVKLGQLTNIVRGGSPRPAGDPRFYDGVIPFLKVADLTAKNEMYLSTHSYSIKEAGLHKTRLVPPDTLMLTNSGATLGIPKICTFQTTFNDGIAAFIFMNAGLYKPFFYYFLASKTSYFLNEASRGQGQPNLNTEIIGETLICLPPLAEQQRIVAKIDQLMALCDNLEQQIDNANSKQTNLLNAVMTKI